MTHLRFIIMALLFGFLLGMEVSHFTLVVPAQANTEEALKAVYQWKDNSDSFQRSFNSCMRSVDSLKHSLNSLEAAIMGARQ